MRKYSQKETQPLRRSLRDAPQLDHPRLLSSSEADQAETPIIGNLDETIGGLKRRLACLDRRKCIELCFYSYNSGNGVSTEEKA